MVHERNENAEGSDQEESEYHFSDDQINYEMESEVPKVAESVTPARSTNTFQNILTKLTPYRRMIIGLLVFFILIFVIYKMLTPSQPTLIPDDIAQQAPKAATPPTPATQQSPSQVQPSSQMVEQQPQAQQAMPIQQSGYTPPASMAPQPITPPGMAMPTAQVQPSQMMQQPQSFTPPPQAISTAPPATMPPTAPPTQELVDQRAVADKLASLEEQNTKFVNLLETQVAQKLADYEVQNKALQERVQSLNKRLANIESSLNRMAQLLRDEGLVKVTANGGPPGMPPSPPRQVEPRMLFTVQAIIPGRAWLKSESGETVTVAEGDILKDYGRIAKIDPYDGVVEIDTGRKIITLSYGTGGD